MKKEKPNTLTQAEQYASNHPKVSGGPEPLRRDKLGRLVFEDGSHLSENMIGEKIFGKYSGGERLEQELSAHDLGRKDRLRRRRMRKQFRNGSATYPKKVCKAYCAGWHSVASW